MKNKNPKVSHIGRVMFSANCTVCDSNRIQTHNHLVHKRTLNHLAKLAFSQISGIYAWNVFKITYSTCRPFAKNREQGQKLYVIVRKQIYEKTRSRRVVNHDW